MKSLDLSTFFGITITFGLVFSAIALGGNFVGFMDLPSFCIVVLGTIFVTISCFSFKETINSYRLLPTLIFTRIEGHKEAATKALEYAEFARKYGTKELEYAITHEFSGTSDFFQNGVSLIHDNVEINVVTKLCSQEITAAAEIEMRVAANLKKSAETAPAMGLIGTLIGLVEMLANLQDPKKLGPSMAVALLTTFYGALLSYVLFFPLAAKIERNIKESMLVKNIYLETLLSIAKRENPRILESTINSLLTNYEKISYFK